MKDLQELFESLGHDEVMRISELQDKKNINPKNAKQVLDYIAQVYFAEMEVESADMSADELDKLSQSFFMSAALYSSVLEGHMQIKSGRLKLTDGNSCSLSLTPKGIKHVENKILNK